MASITVRDRRTTKRPYIAAALGIVAALALGMTIGWQIGEHRSTGGKQTSAAVVTTAPVPVAPLANDAAPAQAVSARGGLAEAITDARRSTVAPPQQSVTVYVVGSQAEADRLQGAVDGANLIGQQYDGSMLQIVVGGADDNVQSSANVAELRTVYGPDNVHILDLRATNAGDGTAAIDGNPDPPRIPNE